MGEVLVAGNAPELKGIRLRRWVGIRVKLEQNVMVGKPDRLRVARIQRRIFQYRPTCKAMTTTVVMDTMK